jgi:hypothetical protein
LRRRQLTNRRLNPPLPAPRTRFGSSNHPGPTAVEFRTRPMSRVLEDLIEKLRSLPKNHPDRPHLTRMVIDLSREIERRRSEDAPDGGR